MTEKDSTIRAVERALEVLNCFGPKRLELTLTEIAREIGLAPSTTSRILSTLEKHNYLTRKQEDQKYCLGSAIARLGSLCFSNMDFRKVAFPYMLKLRNMYNESVSLYVVQSTERVCVERVESTQPLRRVVNIGDHLPLTRGASGRLLLSYMEKEQIEEILANDPFTTLEALEEVRRLGYAVSMGEREAGVTSIAAPIFDAHGKMIAALAMSGPSIRFGEGDIPEKLNKVRECAQRISAALGASD